MPRSRLSLAFMPSILLCGTDRQALVGRDRDAERIDGVVESGLGGPDGDVECLGCFCRREPDVVRQNEDGLLRDGEPFQTAFDQLPIGE